jgi:hypothetical protein
MLRIANIIKTIRQVCWILLLALYAGAALKVDSIHEFLHAREFAELHSVEQESNPCHKSIYHQESKKGCEHKSHITENTKCPLCEYNVTPDQLVEETTALDNILVSTFQHVARVCTEPASVPLTLSARGPPENVSFIL